MIGSVGGFGGMNSTSAAEFQKQMFTRLDKNGDGSLERSPKQSRRRLEAKWSRR